MSSSAVREGITSQKGLEKRTPSSSRPCCRSSLSSSVALDCLATAHCMAFQKERPCSSTARTASWRLQGVAATTGKSGSTTAAAEGRTDLAARTCGLLRRPNRLGLTLAGCRFSSRQKAPPLHGALKYAGSSATRPSPRRDGSTFRDGTD